MTSKVYWWRVTASFCFVQNFIMIPNFMAKFSNLLY